MKSKIIIKESQLRNIIRKVLNETLSNQYELYHFMRLRSFISSCTTNVLKTKVPRFENMPSSPVSRREMQNMNSVENISKAKEFGLSFTRNKNSSEGFPNRYMKNMNFVCRLTFDSQTLNKIRGLRISPINYEYLKSVGNGNYDSPKMLKANGERMFLNADEMEERLNVWQIKDLSNVIKRCEVFVSVDDWHKDYFFTSLEILLNVLKKISNTPLGKETIVYIRRKDFNSSNVSNGILLSDFIEKYADKNPNKNDKSSLIGELIFNHFTSNDRKTTKKESDVC